MHRKWLFRWSSGADCFGSLSLLIWRFSLNLLIQFFDLFIQSFGISEFSPLPVDSGEESSPCLSIRLCFSLERLIIFTQANLAPSIDVKIQVDGPVTGERHVERVKKTLRVIRRGNCFVLQLTGRPHTYSGYLSCTWYPRKYCQVAVVVLFITFHQNLFVIISGDQWL